MEQNNFKLFEVVNETIQDIYDFLIRYIRSFWIVFFRPKLFIELLDTDLDFKKIVRPFNFILFSFILIMLGIELLNEPFQMATMADVKAGASTVRPSQTVISDLGNLNTTNLIMTFLPSILVFIVLSKVIEWVLHKIFKLESNIGYAFIYGISVSCTTFFVLALSTFSLYQISEFLELQLFHDAFDIFILVSILLFFFLVIFPAFLIVRILKFKDIHFVKRGIAFISLLILNIFIISIYGYFAIEPLIEEKPIEFSVLGYEYDENGVMISIMHSDDNYFIFQQNSNIWLNSLEDQGGSILDYIGGNGKIITGKESNSYTLIPPNRIFEFELTFTDDSLSNKFFSEFDLDLDYFKVEFWIRENAESEEKFGILEF